MRLHHSFIGQGSEPVVFLHGLFGQGKNFSNIATSIGDIATSALLDQPNHGRSPWTVEFSLDEQADLIAEWMDEAFRLPVAVVGHSLGGKVAMRLALRYPELVDRLMVVDTSPTHNEATSHFAVLVSAMRNLEMSTISSRSDADRRLASDITDPGVRGFLLQNLRRHSGHWSWHANLDLLGDNLNVVAGWPALETSWDGLTWWVAGGRSDYVTEADVPAMKRLFPRVVQVKLKRAGHWVHADEPEVFVELLRTFLA